MTKKEKKTNKDSYLSAVKFELKKVSWPKIKDIFKYTCATIVFCLVLAGYFSLLNLILSLIKGALVYWKKNGMLLTLIVDMNIK